MYRENIREYWLFLTEDRPAVEFGFEELSDSWTEADLRRRFPGLKVTCDRSFDRYLDDRTCFIDVSAHNHVPAMFVSFFFASGKLNRASVNVPWWHHSEGYKSLELTFGKPSASQDHASAGVRLHGWRLQGGAALYYNRDRPRNPLEWNSMFWNSAAACEKSKCWASE
jgi:hypothetical protein